MKRHDLNKHNHSIGGNGVKQKDSLSIPTWVYTENSSDRGPGFFVTLKARLGSHGYAKTESGFVVGPAITAVISAKDAKSFESDISKEFCDYFGVHWNQEEILQLIPESGPNESTDDKYRALCLASFHQPKLWDMTGRPLKSIRQIPEGTEVELVFLLCCRFSKEDGKQHPWRELIAVQAREPITGKR